MLNNLLSNRKQYSNAYVAQVTSRPMLQGTIQSEFRWEGGGHKIWTLLNKGHYIKLGQGGKD